MKIVKKEDLPIELAKVRAMATRYAEFAQNFKVIDPPSFEKINFLAQAAKSHQTMIETELGGSDNPQPPTLLELLAEIKGRINIPREHILGNQTDQGPQFWRDLDELSKSAEDPGDDIALTQEQYEGWIKQAEDVCEEYHRKNGYCRSYQYTSRGAWLGGLHHQHGVEVFNRLRERHPSWKTYFNLGRKRDLLLGANFSSLCFASCDFRNADLSYCYFRGSEFWKTDLSQANLAWADLSRCNLEGIDMHEARLVSANLREADLSGADLRGVDLSSAEMEGARLAGAKLEGATITANLADIADLPQVNLYGVKGIMRFHFRKYVRKLRSSIEFCKTGY